MSSISLLRFSFFPFVSRVFLLLFLVGEFYTTALKFLSDNSKNLYHLRLSFPMQVGIFQVLCLLRNFELYCEHFEYYLASLSPVESLQRCRYFLLWKQSTC